MVLSGLQRLHPFLAHKRGYISEYMMKLHLAKVFKPNSDLSKMTLEEKTLYELNAVTL